MNAFKVTLSQLITVAGALKKSYSGYWEWQQSCPVMCYRAEFFKKCGHK